MITYYTDGGCRPNPGFGACGFIKVIDNKKVYQKAFYKADTTNNQMELGAVIKALEYHQKNHPDSPSTILVDSQYVKSGIESWIKNWKKNNWLTAKGQPVKNQDLWIRLDALTQSLTVNFEWVKGHSDDEFNEQVDQLCTNTIYKYSC